MPTLDPTLRDQLATVIGKENADTGARIIAEAGAKAAIEALAVHLAEMHPHLKDDIAAVNLRKRLRARARQLGDVRHIDGRHEIGRLLEQTAYEHWHRMLFSRFLAENELLIHPELKVAVTLEECAELAATEGAMDGWELAGRYASRMLPQIFRPDDPLLAVRFAIDDVKKLEALLDSLPTELFRASDSLGWCYQFWQARKKRRINDSEVKIGADELPAVTQLFTEPYMVQFLLHNTLGAWWVGAGRALPVEMPYLRFLDDGAPAAGVFEGWPRLARELKVLDPCCGSGHFLVAAFEILVAFRIAEEGLTAREACDAVLRDNLFGLEIDARCVQIAAFALALAAWTFPGAGGYRPLAPMNVACSGLAISAKKEEWERLGGENARLRAGMGRMWELFKDAPVLGSLIDPKKEAPNPIQVARFEEIAPMLARALDASVVADEADDREFRVAANGVASAATILSSDFTLVCTNVPYLARQKQEDSLRRYCDLHHARARHDLATTMIERCIEMSSRGSTIAVVAPQNSLFLDAYKDFRASLLRTTSVGLISALGPAAFCDMNWWAIRTMLLSTTRSQPADQRHFAVIDLKDHRTTAEKPALLRSEPVLRLPQQKQYRHPDHRIILAPFQQEQLLSQYAFSYQGIKTGDDGMYRRRFWEIPALDHKWRRYQSTVSNAVFYGGLEYAIWWIEDGKRLARRQGVSAWGKLGVALSQMSNLPTALYLGGPFDSNMSAIIPKQDADLPAILAFCSSAEYVQAVKVIDQSAKPTNSSLVKINFDIEFWRREAARIFPAGLPGRSSQRPTQWVFTGHPRHAEDPLQVGIARLLGYRWPDQQPDALDALADKDGIVCLPALRGERPAADRLADLLAAAWGADWHPQTLTDLLAAVGHAGTLEEWLRDAFFKQHCELFHHRPFIWHIWDGHREGFSALVNYHRLDHEGLKSLTYTYLGDWMRTVEIEARAGKSGARDKLAKAKALQQRLAAILEGEAPLDIFVRWKPIEQQPIGWHPDLDDGVRLNLRPFLTVGDVGAKGAGVLRWKPQNIKWGVDDGKNPPGAPWGEVRDNAKHLTLAEKRAARGET